MSATDELRRLLDERGVEHYDHENDEPLRDLSEAGSDPATSWRMGDASVCAVPDKNGTLDIWIDHATPEQAIAATLGNDGVERTKNGVDERERDQLKDENAKLRELLREMWTFTELVDVCGRLSSGGAWNAAKFGERLRELGVVE